MSSNQNPEQTSAAFAGKRVVVTGACGVFGQRIARAFASQGARVCLSDNRQESLQSFVDELPGDGHLTHLTELTDAGSIEQLVDTVEAGFGAADIVINNAGVYPSGLLLDLAVEEWDRIFDVNLRAPFLVAQGFAKLMVARDVKGSIVNIGSGAARNMRATTVHYCTSKTALDRLTKGMSIELASLGIRVNCVEPGFAAGSVVSPLSDEHVKRVTSHIPLGRPSGAMDAPAAILYLCSGEASFITGATLSVDGGNSIGAAADYPADIKTRVDRWTKS
ncbi:MAG: SDR family NAD(P)-dependent oxidoreductase [Granulosicoccus sp.]